MTTEQPEPQIDVFTTFTWTCPFGCTVEVVDTVEQAHTCEGVSAIADAWVSAPTDATVLQMSEHIADALKPMLRDQLFESWTDGVRSGRRGLCYGVDDDVSTAGVACERCGCTDQRACPGGCSWVRPGLCSACAASASTAVTPEGHVDDVGCPCGPGVDPVAGLMHATVLEVDAPLAVGKLTGGVVTADFTLRQPCPAPAPLVVNGSPYVGCSLEQGHDGQHEVRVSWSNR